MAGTPSPHLHLAVLLLLLLLIVVLMLLAEQLQYWRRLLLKVSKTIQQSSWVLHQPLLALLQVQHATSHFQLAAASAAAVASASVAYLRLTVLLVVAHFHQAEEG